MPKFSDPRPVAISLKFYHRLLALYPRAHRQAFGSAMSQLFHDQCRDAWIEARGRGLTVLWWQVSIDLAKTSMAEHFRSFNERKRMLTKLLQTLLLVRPLRSIFGALFAMVFLLCFGSSVLLAWLSPKLYRGQARVAVEDSRQNHARAWDPVWARTELERIQSDANLGRVAQALNLKESIARLRDEISLHWLPLTTIIDIRVYDGSADRAASIANAVAATYAADRSQPYIADGRFGDARFDAPHGPAVLVDRAEPNFRLARPNKPLILSSGVFGGILLALVGGGTGVLLALRSRRLCRPPAALP